MNQIPRLRPHDGPAILSYGFRPFFLLGAVQAGLAVLAWLPMFFGELSLSTAFAPRDWHVHEMLYGYVPAIVTGFLLTAIPNWTGRLPIQGRPLLILVLLWLAGRMAVTMSAFLGALPAALIDVAFLALMTAAVAREILAARNWHSVRHNLKVVGLLGLLTLGNLTFHIEAFVRGTAEYGIRAGIGGTVLLIMLIGGRIVPSFTRNWLARMNPGRLPVPFGRYDVASLALGGLALAAWVVGPQWRMTGLLLIAAGIAQVARLARWAGWRTWRDRLVLILHVAYAFVPLGFLLTGLAALLSAIPPSAGIHAWTGGAFGAMTLAVMSRASLGHTGRPLVASRATELVYLSVMVAALARICAALEPALSLPLLHVAAFAWAGAFLGFALSYGGLLSRPRAM